MCRRTMVASVLLAASAMLTMTVLGGALALGGCSKEQGKAAAAQAEPATMLEKIKAKGELNVGTASGYPPYEFIDIQSPSQEVIGIDMALAKRIAGEIGVKLRVSDMAFDALLASLPAGKIDIAIAGINPTDERKKVYDFSDSYLDSQQKVMIRSADATKYRTLADFTGKKIGAEKGSSQESIAREQIKDAEVIALVHVADCVLELTTGKIEGIVLESTVAQQYIATSDAFVLSDAVFENGVKSSAAALVKGNPDFLAVVNKVIVECKSDGSMDAWVIEYGKKSVENAQ